MSAKFFVTLIVTFGLPFLVSLCDPRVGSPTRYRNVGDIVVDYPEYCPLCSDAPGFFYVNGNSGKKISPVPKSLVPHFLAEYYQKVKIESRTCHPSCQNMPVYIDLEDDEEMITVANSEYPEYFSEFGDPTYTKGSKKTHTDPVPVRPNLTSQDGLWRAVGIITGALFVLFVLWLVDNAECVYACCVQICRRPSPPPTAVYNISEQYEIYEENWYESVV